MDNQKLHKHLEKLQEEIQHTQNVDKKGMDLLREIDTDVRELLERSESDSIKLHPTIIQRLDNTIKHLEVTHPDLTRTLSELMDILSNAGI